VWNLRFAPPNRTRRTGRAASGPTVATRIIGYGQWQRELPLRISTLEFSDSKLVASLQIADLIAGAAVDYLKSAFRKQPLTKYQSSLQAVLFPVHVGGMTENLGKNGESSLPPRRDDQHRDVPLCQLSRSGRYKTPNICPQSLHSRLCLTRMSSLRLIEYCAISTH
jgi:hypothetical protein